MIYTFEEAIQLLENIVKDFELKAPIPILEAKMVIIESLLSQGKPFDYFGMTDSEFLTLSDSLINSLVYLKIRLLRARDSTS